MTFDLNIDWTQLKAQKQWLIETWKEGNSNIDGLLSLLDAIQDQAVDVHGVPETEVFNLTEDGYGQDC